MVPRSLGPLGDQGLAAMSLPLELLHYLWTLLGVHGSVIYGSIWCCRGIVVVDTKDVCWHECGWNHRNLSYMSNNSVVSLSSTRHFSIFQHKVLFLVAEGSCFKLKNFDEPSVGSSDQHQTGERPS